MQILNIVIAIILLLYLFLFLLQILRHKRGTVQILAIIEFVIVLIISLGLILQQFKVFNIAGSCRIIGLVLWIRAVVELFRAYFFRGNESNYKYPVWYFCLCLVLITLGTYMFAAPFFSDQQVVLTLSILSFVASAVLIVLGIIFVPKKNSKTKNK